MRSRDLVLAVACLALFHDGSAAQEPPRPVTISVDKTPDGSRFTSKGPENRFSFEVVGKEVKPRDPEQLTWYVEGRFFQVVPLPVPPAAFGVDGAVGFEEDLLRMHKKWDLDYHAKRGIGEIKASAEEFSSPDGRKCLYWETARATGRDEARKGEFKKSLFASTVLGNTVIQMMYAIADGPDDADGKRFLKETLLSLKAEAAQGIATAGGGREKARPISPLDLFWLGPPRQLVNAELMTPRDFEVSGKVVLKPRDLVHWTRLLLLMREFRESFMSPLATVFDGKSGHVLILMGYDRSTNCFLYSDPWVVDTFLARRNNKAGVNAVAHSAKVDDWRIKEEEFERVLYKVDVVQGDLVHLSRLIATMRGDADRAVAAYNKIKAADPKNPDLKVGWLNQAGGFFLDTGEAETAATVFTVNLNLNPSSAGAHAGLAEAFSRRGRKGPAAEHYKQALDKVSEDPSLQEGEKASLAKQAAEKLRHLGQGTGR